MALVEIPWKTKRRSLTKSASPYPSKVSGESTAVAYLGFANTSFLGRFEVRFTFMVPGDTARKPSSFIEHGRTRSTFEGMFNRRVNPRYLMCFWKRPVFICKSIIFEVKKRSMVGWSIESRLEVRVLSHLFFTAISLLGKTQGATTELSLCLKEGGLLFRRATTSLLDLEFERSVKK